MSPADIDAIAAAIWAEVRSVLLLAIKRNRLIVDPVGGTETIYADDDVTVAAQADAFEDVAGTQPYSGGGHGAERRDRLV